MVVRRSRRSTRKAKSLLRAFVSLQALKRLLEPHGEHYTSRIEALQDIALKRLRKLNRS